jgi:prepilin-type processing-associated H-X9-DG protein
MRQITTATVMFAQENGGWMPGRAGDGVCPFNPQGGKNPYNGTADIAAPGDWIAWQRKIDPVTGQTTTGADQNITYSALAKYMSMKQRVHSTAEEANRIAATGEEVFVCPSDNRASRPADNPSMAYRYSYSMNDLFTCDKGGKIQPSVGAPAGLPAGARFGFTFNGKINSIRNPSERVLLVCEDEQTLDDGVFKPTAINWDTGMINAVAARHEAKFKRAKSGIDTKKNENARGNVGFADGHGEFMSRKDAISQRYSGSATPDPANF